MKNPFKEVPLLTFHEAIVAMMAGKRIRRKSERKGYVKMIIITADKKKEQFGSYWVSNIDDISCYCSFDIEDVLANNWLIGE